MTDPRFIRCVRLMMLIGLGGIAPRAAIAGGLHHGQAGYVVVAPASPASLAPAATYQLAPVVIAPFAPAMTIQVAPAVAAPATFPAPSAFQAPAAPMVWFLAPAAAAPAPAQGSAAAPAQAPLADAPTDVDVVMMAQGFAPSGSSIERFRAKVRDDVRRLLQDPALKKSVEFIVPIALDLAKSYLRQQGFGLPIDETVEGVIRKFVRRAIAENGGDADGVAPPPTVPVEKPSGPGAAVEGEFEIRGRIIIRRVGDATDPDENPEPKGDPAEPDGSAAGVGTVPSLSPSAPGASAPRP